MPGMFRSSTPRSNERPASAAASSARPSACVAVDGLDGLHAPGERAAGAGSSGWSRCRRRPDARRPDSVADRRARSAVATSSPRRRTTARTRTSSPRRARSSAPSRAAHELDELSTDRQPEPRPAEPAGGGRVGLGERAEQPFLVLGRDADAGVASPRSAARTRSEFWWSTLTRITTSPSEVNFTALATRLSRTCRIRLASPEQRRRERRAATSTRSSIPLACAVLGQDPPDVVDDARRRRARTPRARACPPRSWRSRGCR